MQHQLAFLAVLQDDGSWRVTQYNHANPSIEERLFFGIDIHTSKAAACVNIAKVNIIGDTPTRIQIDELIRVVKTEMVKFVSDTD